MLQPLSGLCQGTNLQKPIEYTLQSELFLFNGKSPFWIKTNQYDIVPKSKAAAFSSQGSINADYQRDSLNQFKHLLGWGAKIAPVINLSDTIHFVLPEAYLKLRVGSFEIWGGKRREVYGILGDTLLSSGSYSWSGNAFPMPKIQINTIGFVTIPLTKNFLAFNTNFSHGWFGNMPVIYGRMGTKSVIGYLHQKSFYLRFGKPNHKINFIGGFNHQAQWGGENQIWPAGLPPKEAWWAVVIGKPWEGSRVGNHLGTLDVGLLYRLKNNKSLFFYRQNIYDDGSLYTFLNIQDGLQGVVFSNRREQDYTHTFTLGKLAAEWLNTTNQGGPVFDFQRQIFGRDNYFNHYVYGQGWSYKGEMIGTPFIPAQTDVKKTSPPVKDAITNNNRVQMFHLAANGWMEDWQWLVKASFSMNYGLYEVPFAKKRNQLSVLIRLQKELPWLNGLDWYTSVAFDVGTLYDSSVGLQIGLRKRGFF
ncbi:MAG: capsule assembly Wzi family protein [Spirosomataceae bacterium]